MANLPQFVAGTVLTADALNTTLADAVTAGAEQGALNVQAQANTFAEPQTFDAAIVQSVSAGVNNQSALMNTADAFSDFIANGMQWAIPSSASLTTGMSAGTAYLNSVRTLVPAISGNAFPASNDTYVSFNNSGVPAYQSVANGATAPTPTSGYVQTAKVVTSPIQSPAATLSTSTSGSLASGTYGIALVAFDATGYGAVGASGTVSVTSAQSGSGSIEISWVNPLNETSMDIYATTAGSTTLGLVASGVTGTGYTYTGSVAPGAAAPTVATSNAVQEIGQILPPRPIPLGFTTFHSLGINGDGITDHTTAIQNAVNTYPRLFADPGDYVCGNISAPNTCVAFVGAGIESTTFTPSNNVSSGSPFLSFSADGFEVYGFSADSPGTASVVQVANSLYPKIKGLNLEGGTTYTLVVDGCTAADVSKNIILNPINLAVAILGSHYSEVHGNYIDTAGTDHNIQCQAGSYNNVHDNICIRTGTNDAFCVSVYQETGTSVHDNLLFPNSIEGANLQDSSNCDITDNKIYCGAGHHDYGTSIYAAAANCESNIVKGNFIASPGKAGTALASTAAASPNPAYDCNFTDVHGNTVINPCGNQLSGEPHAAFIIYGDSGATYNTIHDNVVVNGNGEVNYVGYEGAGNYNTFKGNVLQVIGTSLTEEYYTTGASTIGYKTIPDKNHIGTLSVAGNITLTATEIVTQEGFGHIIINTATQTAAFTCTTDTASNILARIPNATINSSFKFRFINNDQSSTGYAGTLAGGTGVTVGTVLPNPAVPKGGYEDYLFTFTAIGSTPTLTVEAIGGNSAALL